MTVQYTPGPWWVRIRKDASGEIVDCFVAAKDINGFAYDACILEDDEYREHTGGIERKIADANLVSAAPDMLEVCEALVKWCDKNPPAGASLYFVQQARSAILKSRGEQ